MAKKKKFVIRHFWRQWVDIVVEAKDEEEAYELADTVVALLAAR